MPRGRSQLRRQPDFDQFLKALRRSGKPAYLPFYEHVASAGFIANWLGMPFDRMSRKDEGYWELYVKFWLDMGYDCVPMEIPLFCPLGKGHGGFYGGHTRGSEATVVIRNRQDFEQYPWPEESEPLDFRPFEKVSALLPEGVKIVGGVCAGPYEWVSWMLGTIGMSYLLADDPDLVGELFRRVGRLHISGVRQLAAMDGFGAIRQGDDLGYKTSTFLSPELLRQHVFPLYKRMVEETHEAGKPFILHSCGNLREVYDDLINDCGIDGKHSFEDTILPVTEFKKRYGSHCTPVGGLDVDKICRLPEDELRQYVRATIEGCFCDGYWLLGTGNSLPDYMPVKQYRIVLEEGMRAGVEGV